MSIALLKAPPSITDGLESRSGNIIYLFDLRVEVVIVSELKARNGSYSSVAVGLFTRR